MGSLRVRPPARLTPPRCGREPPAHRNRRTRSRPPPQAAPARRRRRARRASPGRTPRPAAVGPLKRPARYRRAVALSRTPWSAGTDVDPLRVASTPKRSASPSIQPPSRGAARTCPRRFRRGHPQRNVIPPFIRIGDHHNRFAAMRAVFERLCPGSGERMKTAMDGDRLACTMGFMGGLHHGGIRPPRRRAPRRNGGESRKPHRSGDGTLIHHLPPSASPALSLSKLHIATHIE